MLFILFTVEYNIIIYCKRRAMLFRPFHILCCVPSPIVIVHSPVTINVGGFICTRLFLIVMDSAVLSLRVTRFKGTHETHPRC